MPTIRLTLSVRGGINLLEWDRVGTDYGAGVGGLSFELGWGRDVEPGPCLIGVMSRDFRFNDPDDTFIGIAIGWCRLERARPR